MTLIIGDIGIFQLLFMAMQKVRYLRLLSLYANIIYDHL